MNSIDFQEIRVKLPELRIWFGDHEIFLSLSELRLLLILLTDPWDVFSHQELITRMGLTSQGALTTLTHKLRGKLGRKYIVSIPSIGYSLTEGKN